MGWTTPRIWIDGEIVTKDIMDTHVKDNLRYLKGLDGVPTIESGIIIDNAGGDEYLKLPLLSTAECATVLAAEGQVAHDEATHRIKFHDGTAVRSLVSTADETKQFFAIVSHVGGGGGGLTQTLGDHIAYLLDTINEYAFFEFRVPNDFTTLISVKVIMCIGGTGTFDWTVTTDFGANGEAYNANSDTATGDGQAATNAQFLELDISAAYTGMAANDIVGTKFLLDVLGASTAILYMIGLDIKYS